MAEKFYILRRTKYEKDIFGGEVFIDFDGKNVGKLGERDFEIVLETGEHTLKMYKSHTMGSFIGQAVCNFTVKPGEVLFARYSPPFMTNQSGTLILSVLNDMSQLDHVSREMNERIKFDYHRKTENERKIEEASKKNHNALFF